MAFSNVSRDLRFGLRHLASTPGSTLIAILSLALGIGAATAIYTVIYGVIIDPFPYRDVDRLMSILVGVDQRNGRTYYSTDEYLEIAGKTQVFEHTIASTISDVTWLGGGDPERLRGNHGSGNTFLCMGVPALLGRYYLPSDLRADAEPVVVLGYRFWDRRFGRDESIVGKTMKLDGVQRRIVGVMPPRFMWRGADVYLPVLFRPGAVVEGVRFVHVLGRLKDSVSREQAATSLLPLMQDLARRDSSQFPPGWKVSLMSFEETFPSSIREELWLLFGAVGLLLLIACANTSNLLLARGISRRREMALRGALGADRSRLIRQLLTESLLLATAGGLAGCLLAWGGLRLILSLVPMFTIPDESEVALSLPVLGFSVAICMAAAILFGIVPAFETSRHDIVSALKESSRTTSSRRHNWVSSGFVMAEVALSVVLLVGAALVVRALSQLESLNLGIRTERVITMRVPLSDRKYPTPESRQQFFQQVLVEVQQLPGVEAAGVNTWYHPMGGWRLPVEVPGSDLAPNRVFVHQISPGYLDVMSIDKLAGRSIEAADLQGRRRVALVSSLFAERNFGSRSPLGRSLRIAAFKDPPFSLPDDAFEIVGVVGNTRSRGADMELVPEVYLPYTVLGRAQILAVRTAGEPTTMSKQIQSRVFGVDPEQPVVDVRTMEAILRDFLFSGPRFQSFLFGVFAAMGLLLSAIGLFAVMLHNVSRQIPEISIRLALGAGASDVTRMVLGRAARMLLIGLAIGLALSVPAGRLLRNYLWRVPAFDGVAFATVAGLLLLAGLAACLQPLLRALWIQPAEALRQE